MTALGMRHTTRQPGADGRAELNDREPRAAPNSGCRPYGACIRDCALNTSTHYLLLTTYCLLLTAYYLLLTTYYYLILNTYHLPHVVLVFEYYDANYLRGTSAYAGSTLDSTLYVRQRVILYSGTHAYCGALYTSYFILYNINLTAAHSAYCG